MNNICVIPLTPRELYCLKDTLRREAARLAPVDVPPWAKPSTRQRVERIAYDRRIALLKKLPDTEQRHGE